MEKKQYDPEIALWPCSNPEFARVTVTAAVYDVLQKAEIGSTLLLVTVPEQARKKIEDGGKNAPLYKLVVKPMNLDYQNQRPATKAKDPSRKPAKIDDDIG